MLDRLRPLAVAGSFFPAGREALASEVERCLAGVRPAVAQPRAVISAHAGLRFSGRFAGLSLGSVPEPPRRVAILSPSHRHAFAGLAFPSEAGYATPLGALPIDRDACAGLAAAGLARERDAAHDAEHGIETQLPFVARLWPDTALVPLVIGAAAPAEVAAAIDRLDDGGTLFVLSSDLSHFLSDRAARATDAETAARIERGATEGLDGTRACGAQAIAGWLMSRAGAGARPLRLATGNSGETSGDRSRVVGYGAWAFFAPEAPMLDRDLRARLLAIARRAIIEGGGGAPEDVPAPLRTQGASFVTLTLDGQLRGCIGSLEPRQGLAADVALNAGRAAFGDPRFAPVGRDEVPRLRIGVSVLTRPAPLDVASEEEALSRIVPHRDGLVLSSGGRRGTFLPSVWEQIPDPRAFLRALKAKAGLPPDLAHYRLERFLTESFAEP